MPLGTTTRVALRVSVRRQLNDANGVLWTGTEVDNYLTEGYRDLARTALVFWDAVYAESRPAGFSFSHPWEARYVRFNYGCANFTYDWERDYIESSDLLGPADHTSPADDTGNSDAPSAPAATKKLPDTIVDIDRVLGNQQTLTAESHRTAERWDPRYEVSGGRVRAYTWQKDGLFTLRKVPKPSTVSSRHTVTTTWGLLRTVTDLTDETVSGTWGIARRIPDQVAYGTSPWGLVRRVYHETENVRVEHWRDGRAVTGDVDVYELPDRYTEGVREFALMRCYARPGEGQDLPLAQHYEQRHARTRERLIKRRSWMTRRVRRGFGSVDTTRRTPPLPRLPWNFGRPARY